MNDTSGYRLIVGRDVADLLAQGAEIAFLDVREAGPFSQGHPLFAVPCPWSRFEELVGALVPRRTVPVVLIDAGDGIAECAAHALGGMGYGDVSLIEGGAPAWAEAGLTLYRGVHVPSKTLGELAEERFHPGKLDAAGLMQWREQGRYFRLYDCRPAGEFEKMTVPGAANLPNGELAHRLEALPQDAPIVLTCAGRTRGVIGAASLGLVAPDCEVYWLEDGTQGWTLAGFDLERGCVAAPLPVLDRSAAEAARQRAAALMTREGLAEIDPDTLGRWMSDAERTTYLLDVRSEQETNADPLPAFRSAPTVQLVQATDRWIGVRNARVVLADDLGLRGAITAFWLRALGYETAVIPISDALRRQPAKELPRSTGAPVRRIDARKALSWVADREARFVDVRPSADYAAGHVAGAVWSIRSRLRNLPQVPAATVLVGDDSVVADLAGRTLQEMRCGEVTVVDGGMEALVAAGAAVERAQDMPLARAIDVTSFAHGRHDGDCDASRLYLAWERGLIAQLSPDERAAFRI